MATTKAAALLLWLMVFYIVVFLWFRLLDYVWTYVSFNWIYVSFTLLSMKRNENSTHSKRIIFKQKIWVWHNINNAKEMIVSLNYAMALFIYFFHKGKWSFIEYKMVRHHTISQVVNYKLVAFLPTVPSPDNWSTAKSN